MTVSPDIASMRDSVLFDGPDRSQRISRFWILLILASIIAAAGVVADSTATVIGAMIVAPLMTPILGAMLSLVLADRANLIRSLLLVAGGAAAAVAIGFAVGLFYLNDVVAATNTQVAGRVHPRLIDLLAAVATGAVGSIALVRRDISDTLPGVAIAISLVPPLSVVGLTLESGEPQQAMGALLLFLTNVMAILGSGIVVLTVFKVRPSVDLAVVLHRRKSMLVFVSMLVVIVATLAYSSVQIVRDTNRERSITEIAEGWAEQFDWNLTEVTTNDDGVVIRLGGPFPIPETDSLSALLSQGGIDVDDVTVDLIPTIYRDLGG
jgi:uncharacterized hydrophobic protein (TIGR00271 family)